MSRHQAGNISTPPHVVIQELLNSYHQFLQRLPTSISSTIRLLVLRLSMISTGPVYAQLLDKFDLQVYTQLPDKFELRRHLLNSRKNFGTPPSQDLRSNLWKYSPSTAPQRHKTILARSDYIRFSLLKYIESGGIKSTFARRHDYTMIRRQCHQLAFLEISSRQNYIKFRGTS